jgi:mono/diheme cytochrome c family protein
MATRRWAAVPCLVIACLVIACPVIVGALGPTPAAGGEPQALPPPLSVAQAKAADADSAAMVAAGHALFNQTCAHCHGPDAITGQSERNLRRLRVRYGDDMERVFRTTVMNGRPELGMPVWGEVLDQETIDRIYSYLESIQDRADQSTSG